MRASDLQRQNFLGTLFVENVSRPGELLLEYDADWFKKQRKTTCVRCCSLWQPLLVTLEKKRQGRHAEISSSTFPAVVLCYLIAMLLCTLGVWGYGRDQSPHTPLLKNNLTYAMIFAMLAPLQHSVKVLKLGPKIAHRLLQRHPHHHESALSARFVADEGKRSASDVWMGLCALCGSCDRRQRQTWSPCRTRFPSTPARIACALTL